MKVLILVYGAALRKRILSRKRTFCVSLVALDDNPQLKMLSWIYDWVIRTFGPPLLNPVEVFRLAWYHSEAPWRRESSNESVILVYGAALRK